MNRMIAHTQVGKKNIIFALVLFLILGFAAGLPLTLDLLAGTSLTGANYQAWKVVHAYGVFLAFVNFFFGYCIDRLDVRRDQKEIASWSFMIAGFFGGFGRSVLLLLSIQGGIAAYTISLIETLGFVIGTFVFVRSQVKETLARPLEAPASAVSKLR